MARLQLAGRRFGKLLVNGFVGTDKHQKTLWRCICDCGRECTVMGGNLTKGNSTQCFWCARDYTGRVTSTHRMSTSTEYRVWHSMLQRCTNSNAPQWKDWGGRGIKVCERWLKFENFYADMGPRPSPKQSIDRIDVNGNYEPPNCRWTDRVTQMRNKRSNTTYEGKCIAEWAEELGVKYTTMRSRFNRSGTPHLTRNFKVTNE